MLSSEVKAHLLRIMSNVATAWGDKPVKGAASEVYEFLVLSTRPVVRPVSDRDEDAVFGLILLRQL